MIKLFRIKSNSKPTNIKLNSFNSSIFIIILLLILIIYNFSSIFSSSSSSTSLISSSNNESNTSLPINLYESSLPECKRTFLFEFGHKHGFASEFTLFLRLAVLANHYRYTLLTSSNSFNYGNLLNYFNDPVVNCLPPTTTTTSKISRMKLDWNEISTTRGRGKGEGEGDPIWTRYDHVIWKVRDLIAVDEKLVELFINPVELTLLQQQLQQHSDSSFDHNDKFQPPLFPKLFELIFNLESNILNQNWNLNDQLEIKKKELLQDLFFSPIPKQPIESGLVDFGTSSSSTSGSGLTSNKKLESEVIIGVHVRLGDKYLEVNRKQGPGIQSDSISHYFQKATFLVNSILQNSTSSSSSSSPPSTSLTSTKEWKSKPNFLIMSDDPNTGEIFKRHELARNWNIIELSDSKGGDSGSGGNAFSKDGGFYEGSFNSLPLIQREEITKKFLIELQILSSSSSSSSSTTTPSSSLAQEEEFKVDGLILSCNSNVGRLLSLLAKDLSLNNRVLSVDTRWFPTSHYL